MATVTKDILTHRAVPHAARHSHSDGASVAQQS